MAINKNEFYEKYAPIAIEQQIKYGIPASITLAQMGFESSFGTSRLARESSNFFGVKQGSSWKGPVSYHIDDHNHPEAFRVYQDVRASVEDHSKVLLCFLDTKSIVAQRVHRTIKDGLMESWRGDMPARKIINPT